MRRGTNAKAPMREQLGQIIIAPTSLMSDPHCLERRFTRSVAIRVAVKMRLHAGLESLLNHRLRNPVRYGGYPYSARTALPFRYVNRAHWRRKITTRGKPIPQLIQIVVSILLELFQ